MGADGVAAIEAAPGDVAAVRAAAKALGVDAPVSGDPSLELGVRVRSHRRSTVENSLVARLASLEGELAAEVSRTLFVAERVAGGATEAAEDLAGGYGGEGG